MSERGNDRLLFHAMREEPDVIVIGEIRDAGTMQQAVSFADTGHLCLSTIHAHNYVQALQRVINFYPEPGRQQLLSDLAINLKAIVVQRLIETVDGQRIPAVEMMLCTPCVSELIMNNKIEAIPEVIGKGNSAGCFTLGQSLFELYSEGKITLEEAQKYANSKTNLSMRIRFHENEMYA